MDKDVSRVLSHFTEPRKIGEGTYGTVFKAKCKKTDEYVALKQIRLNQGNDGVPSTCIREICLLKELKHPNIVQLRDVILNKGDRLYMVFEYIDQDLKILMDRIAPRPLPMDNVKIWQGVEKLPDYNESFPRWQKSDLRQHVLGISDDGADMLELMLTYPPMERYTAKSALSHRFLRDVPLNLPDLSLLLRDV
ncbi:protein kinase domain-containing protein [Ditylenchus destructor]|nr:protein kinase domain-containing protein [Ditylenchus destructor]